MRVSIVTVGTRGDVQPYIALGRGLQAAGYDVRLATHARFREFAESHGLSFHELEGNPRDLLVGREGKRWLDSGENITRFAAGLVRVLRPNLLRHLRDVQSACDGSDAIIFSPLGFAAWHVADALRLPCLMAALQPATRTRAFPALPVAAKWSPGGAYNLTTHAVYEQMIWQSLRPMLNSWRRHELGVKAVPFSGPFRQVQQRRAPVLYGFSTAVLPKPKDWPDWQAVTGYWFLDRPAAWTPPAELTAFLDSGSPPVYVGFGSMIPGDAESVVEKVLSALRTAGMRGILASGWMGMKPQALTPDVLAVDEIPHDWLFPRVAAVVHHGGAGTTAAALRAGVPSIVVPSFGDQPFWAQRVERLGAGPRGIPMRALTAQRLAAAIATTRDSGMRARATAIGKQLIAEDGVATAVDVTRQYLERR